MKILAASPLVEHGYGTAPCRIVLKAWYNEEGVAQEYVTHRQYFYSDGTTGYGNGNYFTCYKNALKDFYKRSQDEMGYPLADLETLKRFDRVCNLKNVATSKV